jgi:membrane protein
MNKLEARLINLPPVQSVISMTKKIVLPGFEDLPLYDVIKFFIAQVNKVGLSLRASSIAFHFLMAMPAGTIFLCTLIPYMPISKEITVQLLLLADDFTPDVNTFMLVENFLNDFLNTQRSGLLSLGFLIAIYYSSNAMMGIMRTFNTMIDSRKRNFFESRWVAIKLTCLMILMVITCLFLLIMQGIVLKKFLAWLHINDPTIENLISVLRWVIIIAFIFYMIAFIYKYAPAVQKRWKLSSPGTIIATLLMIFTTFLFSFWVNKFNNYNKIYGSIGTVLIIMLLTYINSFILLIGFELNVSIQTLKSLAGKEKKDQAAQTVDHDL